MKYILCTFLWAIVAHSDSSLINKARHSVVFIKGVRAVSQASDSGRSYSGTGVIIDKKKGIVLTNAHVASVWAQCRLEVQYHNGVQADARVIYADPVVDFAFLQIDDVATIPSDAEEIMCEDRPLRSHESVLMVGGNGGRDGSVQTGHVASVYAKETLLPFQTFIISLNSVGGSSGSPVFDEAGKVIGILYGGGIGPGSRTEALALPIGYVTDALASIKDGRTPFRATMRADITLQNASRLTKYTKADEALLQSYTQHFPDGRNQLLYVRSLFAHHSKEGLKPGDIILKVNGTRVGPSLLLLDRALASSKEYVRVDVLRRFGLGMRPVCVTLPFWTFSSHSKEMIAYGGAVFIEGNDDTLLQTGDTEGGVYCANYSSQGFISDRLPAIRLAEKPLVWKILSLGTTQIRTLSDLKKAIRHVAKERYTTMFLQSPLSAYRWQNTMISHPLRQDVFLDCFAHDVAYVYKWSDTKYEWEESRLDINIVNKSHK